MNEAIDLDAGKQALTLAVFYRFLRKRWRLIFSLFLLLFGAAAAFVFSRPERYEAQMKLMLKRARTDAPIDSERRQAGPAATELSEGEIESEIELFRNRDSLAVVVREQGLADAAPGRVADERARMALAVRDLGRRLAVYRVERTNFIAAHFRDEDPDRAAQVLQRLGEIYLAKHMVLHRNQDTSQFFARQAEMYSQKLDEAQKELADFRQRHRVSLLAAEKEAALRRQDELERTLLQTESEIESARDRTAQLRRQVTELPETVETQSRTARSEALLERLKATVLDLENRRTELLTKYDSSYRLVREVDKQIEDTRRMLAQEQQARVVDRTNALNPLRQSLKGDLLRTETELAGLTAKREKVAQDLREVRGNVLELERITAEHDDLARKVKLAEENFLLYQRKREELRLADAMDKEKILNATIVEQAAPPAVPVDQHRAALLLLSAVMAAFGSLGIALVVDHAAPIVRHAPRQHISVAEVGEPPAAGEAVVEESPAAAQRENTAPAAQAQNELESVLAPQCEPEEESADVPAVVESPGVVEMICRELVKRDDYGHIIDYLTSHQRPDSGLVLGLSPEIGSGEAAVAAVQLAASLHRRNGLPVLLLDAGGARPSLACFFGVAEAPGLQELIAGAPGAERRCIRRTGFENLWILPYGNGQAAAAGALSGAGALHRALSNRAVNVIVYLPQAPFDGKWLVFYSVLDAVLSSLTPEDNGANDADELIRRVIEAKRSFSERRLTLVGGAKEWNSGSEESLTVC